MPVWILAIWYAGIGLKGLSAYRLASMGLIKRMPAFYGFVAVSVVRSVLLACIKNPTQYRQVASLTMPVVLLAEAFAITAAFWLLTEKYPKWRVPGSIFLTVVSLMGVGAAQLVRTVAVPAEWAGTWELVVLLQQHFMVGMAVVLFGVSFLLPRSDRLPVRPIAQRVADVLTIDVATGMIVSTLTVQVGRQHPMVAFVLPLIAGLVNGWLWAFWLPAASDECREVKPLTAEEKAFLQRPEPAVLHMLRDVRPHRF